MSEEGLSDEPVREEDVSGASSIVGVARVNYRPDAGWPRAVNRRRLQVTVGMRIAEHPPRRSVIPETGLFGKRSASPRSPGISLASFRNNHKLFGNARTLSSGRYRSIAVPEAVVLAMAFSFIFRFACR